MKEVSHRRFISLFQIFRVALCVHSREEDFVRIDQKLFRREEVGRKNDVIRLPHKKKRYIDSHMFMKIPFFCVLALVSSHRKPTKRYRVRIHDVLPQLYVTAAWCETFFVCQSIDRPQQKLCDHYLRRENSAFFHQLLFLGNTEFRPTFFRSVAPIKVGRNRLILANFLKP